MERFFRPVDVARMVGISAQSVRKYESLGFLPPAERSGAGYRRYTTRHLTALRTARVLIDGYGWEPALRLMQAVHRGDLAGACAAVDSHHAALHGERERLQQLVVALRAATAAPSVPDYLDRRAGLLRVGEAARQAGVTVSSLRFWEAQGLLHPGRDRSSGYRCFDAEQLRRLHVLVLLRRAGYAIEAARAVLDELQAGRPDKAIAAAERRLADLVGVSHRRIRATAAFWSYVSASVAEG